MSQPLQVAREQVLSRQLSTGQQVMMAVGGALGTGLFLGSGLAVNVAGPAVILSYVIAGGLSLLLGAALTEMSVAHPTAGSFGVHADIYLSPFAGYAVRVSYWLAQVVATGGHMVAVSIYMQYWWPEVPAAVWIVAFSTALIYLNTRAVGTFGSVEYWLAMIKVVAVALFVTVGAALLAGQGGAGWLPAQGLASFAPFGASGVWFGVCFVIYSFIGVEIVGVTSGEAADPRRSVPAAFRRLVLGLSLLYLLTVGLLVLLVPWPTLGVGESPFVSVLARVGIPAAASIMNLVVLSAALSSANANLYLISRMLFSLARSRIVPAWLGAIDKRGTPRNALLLSSAGLGCAVVVRALWPESAYVWFFSVALFGALFVWLMIFVTHLAFRRHWTRKGKAIPHRVRLARATSLIGTLGVGAVLVSTAWVPGLRATLAAGPPWLALLAVGYWGRRRSSQ
jgi:amino acid transporter, AAT family